MDASLIQARRATLILALGLVLGGSVALGGGILGGLVDSGSRRVEAILYGPILVVLPVVAYAIAIVPLQSATRRLLAADREQPVQLARATKSLTAARTVVMVGLIPDGFIALFGGLALIAAADTFDSGAFLSGIAGIGAAWVLLVAAVVATDWIGSARRLKPALVSPDGAWWWDGRSWQAVPGGGAVSVPQAVQFLPSEVPGEAGAPRQAVVAYSQPLNPLAVGSGVMAILSWLVCPFVGAIAAVVMGHIALAKIRKGGQAGRGWALTGLILGYPNVAFFGYLGVSVVLSATGVSR